MNAMRISSLLFSSLLCVFSGPAMAQVIPPSPDLMFANEPDPCGVTYSLAYSPLVHPNSLGCRLINAPQTGDLDEDGFWDQAEAELVWAFLPYAIFDEGEQYADGMVMIYQSRPTWDGIGRLVLEIHFVLLFRMDCWHRGDSETFTVRLVSEDAEARHWRLFQLQFRPESGVCKPAGDFTPNGASMDLEDNPLSLLCAPPFEGGHLRTEVFTNPVFTDRWQYVGQGFAGPRRDSGMIHPKLFISKDKHGLYATHHYCQSTCHSTKIYEDCGGSTAAAGLLLPGLQVQIQGGGAGVPEIFPSRVRDQWDQWMGALQDGNLSAYDPFVYLANLGELGHPLFSSLHSSVRPWFDGEWVNGGEFCGGIEWTAVDPILAVADCAAPVRGKMAGSNPLPECSFSDLDDDGIPDWQDCEPLNRLVGRDDDLDGFCDAVLDQAACEEECTAIYQTIRPWEKPTCLEKCRNPDPCPVPPEADDYCRALINSARFYQRDYRTYPEFAECRRLYQNRWVTLSDGTHLLSRAPACEGLWTRYSTQLERISQWVFLQDEKIGTKKWSICSRPLITQEVLWAGGADNPFGTGTEEVRPTSLMLCGCDPEDPDLTICREQCEYFVDPPTNDRSYWHAFLIPETQWRLPGVFGAVPANEVGEDEARHRAVTYAPYYSHRKLTLDWSDTQFRSMHGTEVRTRLSFPARAVTFDGRQAQELTQGDYRFTSIIPSSMTDGAVTCREVQKADLGCLLPGSCVRMDGIDPDSLAPEIRPLRVLPADPATGMTGHLVRGAPVGSDAVALLQPLYDHGALTGAPIPVLSTGGLTREQLTSAIISTRSVMTSTRQKEGIRRPVLLEVLTTEGRWFRGVVQASVVLEEVTLSTEVLPIPFEVRSGGDQEGLLWAAGPVTPASDTWSLTVIQSDATVVSDKWSFAYPQEYAGSSLWWSEARRVLLFIGVHGVMGLSPEKLEWLLLVQGPTANFGETPFLQATEDPERLWVLDRGTRRLSQVDLITGEVTSFGSLALPAGWSDLALGAEGDQVVALALDDTGTDGSIWRTVFADGHWSVPESSEGISEPTQPWYPQEWTWENESQTPPARIPGSEGCSCRSPRSSSDGGWFIAMLGALLFLVGRKRLRCRRGEGRVLLILALVLGAAVMGCDDTKPRPVEDVLGDADADADMGDADGDAGDTEDLIEYRGCTPWSTTEAIPPGALQRVPHAGVDGTPWKTHDPAAFGNWVAFDQTGLWVVDILTMDATMVNLWGRENFIYEDRLVSRFSSNDLMGLNVLNSLESLLSESPEWTIEISEFSDNYKYIPRYGRLGNDYIIFYKFRYNMPEEELASCDVIVKYFSTEEQLTIRENLSTTDCLFPSMATNGNLAAWCEPLTSDAGRWGLKVFDSLTRETREWPLGPDLQCVGVSSIDADNILPMVGRMHRFLYEGTVYEDDQYMEVVVNAVSGEVTPVGTDLFYDRAYGVLRGHLLVERDYGAFCMGSLESSWELAYLVLEDLETGVRRPIGIPGQAAVPEDLQELFPLELVPGPWRLIFTDNGSWTGGTYDTRIYVLDLELSGYVDELGHVIPAP